MVFVSGFKRLLVVSTLIGLVSASSAFAAQPSSQPEARLQVQVQSRSTVTASSSSKPIDIVFDLDDTLIRWVRPDEKIPENAIHPDGEALLYYYRILEGAPELLQSLANRPNVRISFFSLGSAERNEAVLKAIKLPDGRSAWDIAHKVLSDTDASPHHEKDMTQFNPDLNQVLIVDDKVKTTIKGQERNVIRISPKVAHHYSTIDEEWDNSGETQKTTPQTFVQSQNKLAFAEGILNETFERIQKDHISPLDAATQVQYSTDSNGAPIYRENLINDLRFYRKGAADFHRVNPAYRFTGVSGKQPINRKTRPDLELFGRFSGQTKDYDLQISQLRKNPEGTILRFYGDHGETIRFKLLSYISSGKTTSVFRAQPLNGDMPSEVALRIPIGTTVREEGKGGIPAQEFINQTIHEHALLAHAGVAIPKIYAYSHDQFVANELITHDFDGMQFFAHPETLSPAVLQEADRALEEFALTISDFKQVGDFGPEQIVYNIQKKKWTLLDYAEGTEQNGLFGAKTPFDDYWFERSLLEGRKKSGAESPELSSREKELISRLSRKIRESRTLSARIRCVSKAIVGK